MSLTNSSSGKPAKRQKMDETYTTLIKIVDSDSLMRRAVELPCMQGRCSMYIRNLVDEYLKFLLLKSIANDVDASELSPSGEVDAIWHLHLLDTKSYVAACKGLNVSLIHHDPDGGRNVNLQQRRLSRTRSLYQEVFGYSPHPDFWGKPDFREENVDVGVSSEVAKAVPVTEREISSPFDDINVERTEQFQIFIKKLTGKKYSVDVLSSFSILHLKFLIQAKEGLAPLQHRLIAHGKQLEDENTLSECNIREGSIVDFIREACGC